MFAAIDTSHITTLKLDCYYVWDVCVKTIGKFCPNIEVLNLVATRKTNPFDSEVDDVSQPYAKLQSLTLSEMFNLSFINDGAEYLESVVYITSHAKNLKILNIQKMPLSDADIKTTSY